MRRKRRRIETMFRDLILSILVGFVTGFITTQTLMLFLWKRTAMACKFTYSKPHELRDMIGRHETLLSETPNKKLLFIGVMTTRKNLKTKAQAIYGTWGRHVPGRLVFFVGSGDRVTSPLPVIELSDVADDAYPPREKSFAMLKHMYQNHGNYYDWFMRTDDDVYVQTDLLETFLRSINSSSDIYMGHPGTGTPDEIGRLGLEGNRPYCMGGPGVIFTGSTLRKLSDHLWACLNDTVTSHEDSELGRCVRRHVGLSCTSSKQFRNLFHQNYKDKTGAWVTGVNHVTSEALTFHPVKETQYLYSLRIHLEGSRLRRMETKQEHFVSLIRTLENSISALVGVHVEDSLNNCSTVPCDVDFGAPWECIHAYDVYSLNSASLKESVLHRGTIISLANAKHALYAYVKREKMSQRLRLANVSYQRLSADRGLEHVIIIYDNELRFYAFRTVETFGPVRIREEPLIKHFNPNLNNS